MGNIVACLNGLVESAWMFSFLQCDVYWMTGPPFLWESASIDKATSLWRLLIEVAMGDLGRIASCVFEQPACRDLVHIAECQ